MLRVDVCLGDEIRVDLNGLELGSVVLVSIGREGHGNFLKAFCEYSALLVSLGELLRLERRGVGLVTLDSVRGAHRGGELR